MNAAELKALAHVMLAIADGAEWECLWENGWSHPCGRDLEFCISKRIPIRLKPSGAMVAKGEREEGA